MIGNIVLIWTTNICAGYIISIFYAATLLAVIIALLDMLRLTPKDQIVTFSAVRQNPGDEEQEDTAPTETSPLIEHVDPAVVVLAIGGTDEEYLGTTWILELLLMTIIPVALTFQLLLVLLSALGPTVVDGSKPLIGEIVHP